MEHLKSAEPAGSHDATSALAPKARPAVHKLHGGPSALAVRLNSGPSNPLARWVREAEHERAQRLAALERERLAMEEARARFAAD